MLDYYRKYHLEQNSYNMKMWKNTSRVQYLVDFITKHTKPGEKVLDVGCGDMYLAERLPEFDWTGIDINPDMSNKKAVTHNIEEYPYPFSDGQFDTVVCSEVLEHVFNPLNVNKEIKRILKPNGIYVLSTPNFDWIDHFMCHFRQLDFDYDRHWTMEHIHQYTPDAHTKLLFKSGFEVLEYMGADAQYSEFFAEAREVLQKFIIKYTDLKDPESTVTDQLIGAMFKRYNHTIMLVAKSK